MHREVRASLKAVFADPALNSNPALIQQPWLVPNSTLPLGKGNLKCYRMYNMKYLYERGVSNQRHYNNTLNMKTQEDRTDVMFLLAVSVAHRWLRVLKFGSEIIFNNNKMMKT